MQYLGPCALWVWHTETNSLCGICHLFLCLYAYAYTCDCGGVASVGRWLWCLGYFFGRVREFMKSQSSLWTKYCIDIRLRWQGSPVGCVYIKFLTQTSSQDNKIYKLGSVGMCTAKTIEVAHFVDIVEQTSVPANCYPKVYSMNYTSDLIYM